MLIGTSIKTTHWKLAPGDGASVANHRRVDLSRQYFFLNGSKSCGCRTKFRSDATRTREMRCEPEKKPQTPPKIRLFIKCCKLEPILRRVYVCDVYVERVMYILDKEQRFRYVLVYNSTTFLTKNSVFQNTRHLKYQDAKRALK